VENNFVKYERKQEKTMGLFKNTMKIFDNGQEFSIWDKYALKALINRKITISDNVLNKYLRSLTSKHTERDLKELEFHSLNGNIFQLNAVTNKIGKVKMKFEILEMKHNNKKSFIKLELKSKEIVKKAALSWALSKMTAGMLSKFFGDANLGEGMKLSIKGNIIVLDFRDRLQEAKAGMLSIKGQPLLNAVHINGVTTHKDYLEFNTDLKVKQFVSGLLEKH